MSPWNFGLVLKHEYWPDSAGAGEWRGGMGVHTLLKTYALHPAHNVHGDGAQPETAPFGLFGGHPGAPNRVLFHRPDGSVTVANLKENYILETGTVIECFAGGGGGYGDPRRRAPEKVREDVRNGLVSAEVAGAVYGVTIDPETRG